MGEVEISLNGPIYECIPQAFQHAYRLIIDVQAGLWQGPTDYFLWKLPQSGPVVGVLGWGIQLSVGWSVAGATDALSIILTHLCIFMHHLQHSSVTRLWV